MTSAAFKIEEVPTFRVTVPVRVPVIVMMVLTFLAVIFNIGWLSTSGQRHPNTIPTFTGWVVALAAAWLWIWRIFGHEVVSFEGSSLILRYELLGASFSLEFERIALRNLRARGVPVQKNSLARAHDELAFDYGARTYTFGTFEPTDAEKLAGVLVQRFPELRPAMPVVIRSL